MTALPGGAADKSGNAYEALWTALRIADLLRGEASSLRIEPVGDDGLGIEFQVQLADGTWGEQTKHSVTTWTIKRLRDEGALAAAKHQVGTGIGYRLITSSAATALDQLSQRARATSTLGDFESSLSEKLRSDYQDLKLIWVILTTVVGVGSSKSESSIIRTRPYAGPSARRSRSSMQAIPTSSSLRSPPSAASTCMSLSRRLRLLHT